MSAARAPTARRMPISRVRSVTESSMMFMMPMPPTSSETAATLASSAVMVWLARSSVLPNCSSVTFSSPATLPTTDRATSGRIPPLRQRLASLAGDGEIVRALECRFCDARAATSVICFETRVTSPTGCGGDGDVVELRQIQQPLDGGERNVDRRRTDRHRARAPPASFRCRPRRPLRNGCFQMLTVLPTGFCVAEEMLLGDRAEHDHLLGA